MRASSSISMLRHDRRPHRLYRLVRSTNSSSDHSRLLAPASIADVTRRVRPRPARLIACLPFLLPDAFHAPTAPVARSGEPPHIRDAHLLGHLRAGPPSSLWRIMASDSRRRRFRHRKPRAVGEILWWAVATPATCAPRRSEQCSITRAAARLYFSPAMRPGDAAYRPFCLRALRAA
jgi:hypothetical protein